MEKYDFIKGKCMQMCPQSEIEMREREKLLHVLEMVPGTEKNQKPKADPLRMVKCFSRSAAGKNVGDPNILRPPEILLKTVYYLFNEIASSNLSWIQIYDFIADRLRAVRQDMVIQNISLAESISLLQPIVRFYVYSAYRLCEENITNFDPVLNNKHLQECLKKLLTCYDAYDVMINAMDGEYNDFIKTNRPEFEAIYLIFNLEDKEALFRYLKIPKIFRTSVVNLSFNISLASSYNHFVKICRLARSLPPLLAGLFALKLPIIRRRAFQVMSIAYNSKVLVFPLGELKDILLYSGKQCLRHELKHYGFKIDQDSVHLVKVTFSQTSLPPRHEEFVKVKLNQHSIQRLILYCDG